MSLPKNPSQEVSTMTDSKVRTGHVLGGDDSCLTASEMAELARVKVKAICEWSDKGLIPGVFKTRRL